MIGKVFNLKYVPVGILLDEEGLLAKSIGPVNIDESDFSAELLEWVLTGTIPAAWSESNRPEIPHPLSSREQEADERFQRATQLLEQNNRAEALVELRAAVHLDPDNWVIRKQLWAVETPLAFYKGEVDYVWQKEQIKRENSTRGESRSGTAS